MRAKLRYPKEKNPAYFVPTPVKRRTRMRNERQSERRRARRKGLTTHRRQKKERVRAMRARQAARAVEVPWRESEIER